MTIKQILFLFIPSEYEENFNKLAENTIDYYI